MKETVARILKLAEKYEFMATARRHIDKALFNQMRTWQARSQWLKENGYPLMGEGSARATFLVNPRKAIKIAKNEKGVAQNQVEWKRLTKYESAYFPKAFDKAPDDSWIEVELVRPFNNREQMLAYFEASGKVFYNFIDFITQIDYSDDIMDKLYEHYQNLGISLNRPNLIPEAKKELQDERDLIGTIMQKGKLIDTFQEILFFGMNPVEFNADPSHFGLAGDGRLVITDIGLDENVYNRYYVPKGNGDITRNIKEVTDNYQYPKKLELTDEEGNVIPPTSYRSPDPKNIINK